ncbi:GNAT family N-acetyltransferase [Hymenobacter chitinivorans]|uniref:Ribosomal protein S18 acetylase RimI-like enzyme n=1 Tax=Hymenobacter chitinivorans DSM 11115 TaxID=1121954 RepID=A0A2M9B4S3_9BACT|nr:GNAT family N-acetyltransferase [Hymenobacter chitinivorans]PJJ52944.1 ribosomal protein S18 acetylase RimI-like enzyme [Hymenobacter chitinivorans DSM 11115]
MNPTFTITSATAADVPALVAFVNSVYRGETSRQGWTTEAHLLDGPRIDAESLAEMLTAQGATLLMARNAAGALVGSVYLQQQPAGTMYLGMLSVDATRQGGGIGKYLLGAADDYARAQGCSRMKITVISVRHELLAWYERQGYRRTGAVVPFPDNPRFGIPRQPLELLVLEKEL